MVEFAVQRANMVDSQVRPSDVTDRRIPRAMLEVPREVFVPAAQRALAYKDDPIRLHGGSRARTMPAPRLLAKMLQHLEIGAGDSVLDIGCTTGYAAAVLARLAKTVTALEDDATLAETARRNLAGVGASAVRVEVGPLPGGWAPQAPYDAILLEGSVAEIPATILDQLKDGGRLAAIISEGRVGRMALWQRTGARFDSRVIFDAEASMLPGFEKPVGFVF